MRTTNETRGSTIMECEATALAMLAIKQGQDELVYLLLNRSIRERISIPDVRFNIDSHNDASFVAFFRFTKDQVHCLLARFRLSSTIILPCRTRVTDIEATLILLRRLSFPNRWIDIAFTFGRSKPVLCRIFMYIYVHGKNAIQLVL